jgi:hypothetical protein
MAISPYWRLPFLDTQKHVNNLEFEVLKAASIKMAVLWVAVPCRLIEIYRRFRDTCCLHDQCGDSLHGPTALKMPVALEVQECPHVLSKTYVLLATVI